MSWNTLGRIGYYLNSLSIIVIGVTLFYIIYYHLFVYHYARAYSSRDHYTHYIISSFWEGQEGSFWLWMFWQVIIAGVLVWKAKSWESPVMVFVMLCLTFLASMLLGVEVFGSRIGSSPFILLRDALEAPIF